MRIEGECNYGKGASLLLIIAATFFAFTASAHNVSREDIETLRLMSGVQLIHYTWLGAKHMVTGYDHLLFLLGVIYYIQKTRDVLVLVSLFAISHSVTLISGVVLAWNISPYLVDAIIGFSVLYKGLDNLGGLDLWFDERPDERMVVLVFGLFHGLGLATKLQALAVRDEGLIPNLLAFNVGVELGQIVALIGAVLVLKYVPVLRAHHGISITVNSLLVVLGLMLMAYQLRLYYLVG